MSATDADPQSESTRLHRESRTWRVIRRTLPFGRSIGSLLYLISIGLIAGWIIAVFFGVSFFVLMPRSAKLEPGASPSSANFNASLTEAPLDRLSTPQPSEPAEPMSDAAADKDPPAVVSGRQNAAKVNPLPTPTEATIAHMVEEPPRQSLMAEPGTAAPASGETAPMPASQSQPSAAPEPRGAPQSHRAPSSRKPLERRPSNARTAQPHAPVSAIEDVLQKHSRLLK